MIRKTETAQPVPKGLGFFYYVW